MVIPAMSISQTTPILETTLRTTPTARSTIPVIPTTAARLTTISPDSYIWPVARSAYTITALKKNHRLRAHEEVPIPATNESAGGRKGGFRTRGGAEDQS